MIKKPTLDDLVCDWCKKYDGYKECCREGHLPELCSLDEPYTSKCLNLDVLDSLKHYCLNRRE